MVQPASQKQAASHLSAKPASQPASQPAASSRHGFLLISNSRCSGFQLVPLGFLIGLSWFPTRGFQVGAWFPTRSFRLDALPAKHSPFFKTGRVPEDFLNIYVYSADKATIQITSSHTENIENDHSNKPQPENAEE